MLAAPPLDLQCRERPADPSQPRAQAGWEQEVTEILVICPVGMVTPPGVNGSGTVESLSCPSPDSMFI